MNEPLRILVTGSRTTTFAGDTLIKAKLRAATADALAAGREVIIVHGQCPYGGADLTAHRWAEATPGCTPEPHPAWRNRHGRILGGPRNTEMVERGAHECLAFPGPYSVGTIDCLVKAIKAGIPTHVWPLR